jgi:predicted type IV restriction endonuclease
MNKYPLLNFGNISVRLKNSTHIFDSVRKKWLVLTPEEWVRQHVVNFLHEEKGYPKSLMAIEAGLKVNKLSRRSDLLLAGTNGEKIMLVECKAPSVKITQDVFDQIARYNMTLRVKYLLVTNGLNNYCCSIDFEKEKVTFLQDIPVFSDCMLS